jgi:hypothetical protein
MMLSKAGHLSHEPDSISVEGAILADPHLQYEDKRLQNEFYRRLVRTQPTESSTAA